MMSCCLSVSTGGICAYILDFRKAFKSMSPLHSQDDGSGDDNSIRMMGRVVEEIEEITMLRLLLKFTVSGKQQTGGLTRAVARTFRAEPENAFVRGGQHHQGRVG